MCAGSSGQPLGKDPCTSRPSRSADRGCRHRCRDGRGLLVAAPAAAGEGDRPPRRGVPTDQISIQLYTLRDQLAVDFAGTMAALAAIGYRRVEHAGFVGRTVQEFKAVTDANDIWVSSGHVSIPQPFDEAAWNASLQDALVLGSTYIVHPFFGIDFGTGEVVRDTATWAAFAEDLNKAGRMARDVGLRWAITTTTGSSSRSPTTRG